MAAAWRSRVFIRLGSGRFKRIVTPLTAAVMVLSLAEVLPAPASAAPPVKTPTKPTCPDERPDATSASVSARLCGKKILVTDQRTETTEVWALPQGGFTSQVYGGPVRTKQGDVWKPVDLTLQAQPDGSVAPVAHPRGLKLAGKGGSGEHTLAAVTGAEQPVSLVWDGALPAPTLAGNVATYPEVRPGVDLVVTATRTGFEQFFVVKNRAALDSARTLALRMRTPGAKTASDGHGGLLFQKKAGASEVRMPTPTMWDASVSAKSGDHLRRAPVAVKHAQSGDTVDLTLTPDAAFLADPALQFPVTIDPSINPVFDTFVQTGYTSDESGSTELKLGYSDDGGSWTARSFLRWDTAFLAGADVTDARVYLWETHSWSCTAAGWEVWTTSAVGTGTRWTNQPTWYALQGSSTETKGFSSSCNDGWVSAPATGLFQTGAGNSWPTTTMGLKAVNETDHNSWKKFNSSDAGSNIPYATITYNSRPQVHGWSTAPPTACATGAGRPYLNTKTPVLQAFTADPDGGDVVNQFEWNVAGGALVGSASVTAPSSTQSSTTVPAGQLTEGGAYSWRVRAVDRNNANLASAWTQWCEFGVDTVKPGVPIVSSTLYPSIATDNTWGHGGYGQVGSFTISPGSDTDVVSYTYQLDTAPSSTTVAATGSTTVQITPSEDGRRTLTVRSKDRAGNVSDPNTYVFNVGRAGIKQPAAGANVVKRTKLSVDGDGTYTRATFRYRRGPGAAEYDIPLAHLKKANGTAVTAYPVTLTDLGANGIWNAIDTLGTVGGVVQVQAVLYPAADGQTGYPTQWVTVTVDPDGDGAAGDEIGPGSVNLLTGDYSLSSSDADEFGLSVGRSSSSRKPEEGWLPQGERLLDTRQQVTAATVGITPVSPTGGAVTTGWGTTSDHRLVDFDGDGRQDIVARNGNSLLLWLSTSSATTGSYSFAPFYSFGSSWNTIPNLLPIADYSGDGKPDIAGLSAAGELYMYRNTSTPGSVSTAAGQYLGGSWGSVTNFMATDFDGDGRQDLIGRNGSSLLLWLSTSTAASFSFAPFYSFGSSWNTIPTLLPMADYDGDGKPDIAGFSAAGELYIYRNASTPGVINSLGGQYLGGGWGSVTDWRTVDFDGNGGADLIGRNGNDLFLWRSTSTATSFSFMPFHNFGSGWNAITKLLPVGDLDGDGRPDLAGFGGTPANGTLYVNRNTTTPDGFTAAAATAIPVRVGKGQGGSHESLQLVPLGAGSDTYAAVEGDNGALRLGMQAGRRYRFTGWIYVPAATGLTPTDSRGLRIVGIYKDSGGTYQSIASSPAAWVDGWQELSVDMSIPAGATEAFFRLYNGNTAASGKKVSWDNLSLRELVAPFGPQWRGGADGGVAETGYESLTFPSAELAKITNTDGEHLTFARSASGQFFPEPGAEDLTLAKVSDTVYELRELDGTVTQFVKQDETFLVSTTWTAEQNSTTRYLYESANSRTLVKKVINATEPGVGDCTTAVPARGCEVLEYEYATATTATSTTFGNIIDQVRAVKVWSWDPTANAGAGAETAVEVANYAYDNLGRLREVWDPRLSPPLKTTYEYDTAGRVTKVGAAGQLPWMFDYGTITGDTNAGRLTKVRRAALVAGTKSTLDGEVATTVVYGVPLTKAAGGPHDLDAAAIATWGQKDLPTDATAVFSPESVPTVNLATATVPGTGGYGLANITYLNASGQPVNTAVPGNFIDSQSYDEFGNVVWSLEATNRDLALGLLPDSAARIAELNLPADTAARAGQLATISKYSPDGLDLVETLGPVVKVALERQLVDPTGTLPTLQPGTRVLARGHTTYIYDEGKPDGATYHLETTERAGGAVAGYPDADVREIHTGYAAVGGGVSGWALKRDTSTTTDAGTAYTSYDAAGRVLKSWGIGSNGTDARATETLYYTAGAHASDAACGNKPEWAGSPCVTRAVGTVAGHDPLRATNTLPVKRVEAYSRFGDASIVSETSAGKTRRTTTVYNSVDRVTSVTITSDDGSIAQDPVLTEYDSATGLPWKTTAGTAVISREYDQLGRVVTYTDADGGVTTSQYNRYGKATRVQDNTGWTTYTYDFSLEPRGMLTSLTDSVAGTFNAKYSPDGQLTEVKYPGGITRTDSLDANFQPVSRVYKRDSDSSVIYSENVVENTAGQWIEHSYTGGSKTYGYDGVGRLTSTAQLTMSACNTRTYGYDARTNRTSKNSYTGCQTTTPDITETHTYDTADRLMDLDYVHDAFGRITTTPSGLVNTYYADDLVAQQVLGTTKQNWTLDPAHRFRGFTTSTLVGGMWSNASSKLNHYGDDSDEPRWVVEDSSATLTRNVSGPDGDLIATTAAAGGVRLQLTNLHGDVAMSVDTALTDVQAYSYDEFGVPDTASSDRRYGWLGGKQRSGDALGDIILMGVRMYSPSLGRFLQVDPVPGGNSNAYDYCSGDGVNCTDLDGKWGWGSIKKALNKVAVVASYASMIPGPIGTFAGVVSAVAYVATGNWKEAAWAVGGALAATVGAGAAVKGARVAIAAAKASGKAGKFGAVASKVGRGFSKVFQRGCNSFAPNTPVLMADGSYLPISVVQPGDWVVSIDPKSGESTVRPVLDVIVAQSSRHLVTIDLDSTNSEVLVATAEHPIWVAGKGWTEAQHIVPGDFLRTDDKQFAEVVGVGDAGIVADVTMYNLTIGDEHTFVVGVDGAGVTVHNARACKIDPYRRPRDATTAAQRAHVNRPGAACHTCGRTGVRMIADHKVPIVVQYYANNGKLNIKKLRRVSEVLPQCRPCSQKQSVATRRYSMWKRKVLGI